VLLATEAEEVYLPLVTAFVENAARCYGLADEEALGLTLAAEEVFVHLCRVAIAAGGPLEVHCSGGGYYVETAFVFQSEALDLRAFNLTTTISAEDELSLDGMGLVIASRFVDRFNLSREKGQGVRLTLIKEKSYPLHDNDESFSARPVSEFSLRPPSPEEVKFIGHLARIGYSNCFIPDFFLYPGKLADMIATGGYQAVAAFGSAGEIGGAMLWRWIGQKMVECFGPYVFNQPSDSTIPEALVEGCIGGIARTRAVGLVNTCPTPQLPEHHFERLGSLDLHMEDGTRTSMPIWFRLMQEDAGSVVWTHPEFHDYLQREYRRLVLPREIRLARNAGESLPKHSVLSPEFDRNQGRVILRPMWSGADAAENIGQHLMLLQQEGIRNILFALDLGHAWQADFVPGLRDHRFEPCCVLPYAGEGDVLLFQFSGERP
jgi:anti-sigma regulatory factor (Ser/Thr protein kinase)